MISDTAQTLVHHALNYKNISIEPDLNEPVIALAIAHALFARNKREVEVA